MSFTPFTTLAIEHENHPTEHIKLFFEGDFELLKNCPDNGFGIIGSREPTEYSLTFMQEEMSKLRTSNLIIISGLARGIDTAAHRLALEYGLKTIAVMATPMQTTYPKENTLLRKTIIQNGGLIISEFFPNSKTQPYHFLQRNRIIAWLSSALWIVQAGKPSGALNTAQWGLSFGRTCFVTPSHPKNQIFAGNHKLLDENHATAFIGAHNLGSVWISLASLH